MSRHGREPLCCNDCGGPRTWLYGKRCWACYYRHELKPKLARQIRQTERNAAAHRAKQGPPRPKQLRLWEDSGRMAAPRRLTDAQVAEIRARHQPGLSLALAEEFGVHRSYIDAIARGFARPVTAEAAPLPGLAAKLTALAQRQQHERSGV